MAQWIRMLMATSALIGATMATQAAPPHGGTFNFARNADSQFLDPVLNNANVDIWILTNLNSGLLTPEPDGLGVKPGLATSWGASPDGKTFTVKLRPDTKFSDGSPVTTDDVIWSLNRAKDPKIG